MVVHECLPELLTIRVTIVGINLRPACATGSPFREQRSSCTHAFVAVETGGAYPHCMGLTNWLQHQHGSLGQLLSKLPVSLVGLLPERRMPKPDGPSMSPDQRNIILDRLE